MARGTADSLATASLLAHLVETGDESKRPDATALIQRAARQAPDRPEILWLLLRDCGMRRCPDEKSIAERLRAADPDNALALLPALNASRAGPAADTTRIVARIAAAKRLSLYWNKSLVMLFDALTHGKGSPPATAITHDADDRLTLAAGVLAAIDIPPFKPIMDVCGSQQLKEDGRRAACEALMARLDASDSIIAQSLSVSVQSKWWPAGSPEAQALRARRLQQEYEVQAAGRVRQGRVDADAELRVAALRQSATEEEADRAVLGAFQEPLERPSDWQSPAAPTG